MKKLGLLVIPLTAISFLTSCGGNASLDYLELWNKETIYNEDGTVSIEETRKYQDKKVIQQVITEYSQESSRKDVTTFDYTYNEYGDVTIMKETHEIIENNKASRVKTIRYAYQYQDGLMISKDIYYANNAYKTHHIEYQYDTKRRLVCENGSTTDRIPTYDDTYTYQNNFTNYLTYEHIEHAESPGEEESYRTERTLDKDGYPTEEIYYNLSNSASKLGRYTYEYDKYHCLILEKKYSATSINKEKLKVTITTSYHHHNPNKPEKIEKIHHTTSPLTLTQTYAYDKYNRKTCIDTVEKIVGEETIETKTKTTYEYDELIKV